MHFHSQRRRPIRVLTGIAFTLAACCAQASDWIVSGNDGKYQRVEGYDTYPADPRPDTLTLLDASHFPPKVAAEVEVENGIQGPPQAVAITPDAALALVGALRPRCEETVDGHFRAGRRHAG